MITVEEKKFLDYWELNRQKEKKTFYKLAVGLPMGLVFGLPVLLSVVFKNWYKSMSFISNSQVIVIMIAVLGITVFYALFRMHHKWERNETFYQELKFKETQEDNKDAVTIP